ncbi:MAG TPA: pilus assembly protein PilM [Candidatus Paceibacterota bacterium]|nr:pilus assembly protein PilM [Candidatus Paceibacterota bacterium]
MNALSRRIRVELPPPPYLSLSTVGIDISTSGIKIARLRERAHGLELADFDELPLPSGTVVSGEIRDPAAVIEGLKTLAKKHHIHTANIGLPESRGYLFEAEVPDGTLDEAKTAVEQRLDEYVPLPASEVAFAVARLPKVGERARVVGAGYSHHVLDDSLAAMDGAGIETRAIESETFALPRALLRKGDEETVLIIDIGKTTTKLLVATNRLPRYVTTLDIGGHALTLAVAKYFGVSEEEAKRVKAERGIVAGVGNEEYLASMLTTVSVIREEIGKRLDYWQTRPETGVAHDPVTRVILVGGNATVLGLPEYLQTTLKVPVELGDVFANFAPRDKWLPPLEYTESLAYGTAIGLALREYVG